MKLLKDMTEPELRHTMSTLARQIVTTATMLGVEKPMFVLLLFNDPAVAQYVANCERKGVIEALLEAAGRLQRNEDIPR